MADAAPVGALGRRRKLSLFDVLAIGINATVGSGVFALPDDLHRAMGGWSPFAYVLCALLLLPVALSFAELSGRFPETGGAYVYARYAFGAKLGFLIGWYCWANTFISWAANTTLFVELCGVPAFPYGKAICAAGILGLGAINYFGVKPGAFVVNAVVIGKVLAILSFVAVAIFAFDPHRFGGVLPRGVAGVGQGAYLALFPLQGFEVTPVTAGESANPRRNVPLATMGALVLSALLFVVVQTVLVGAYPNLGKESETPLVDAAYYLAPTLGILVFIGSMVSIGGFTAGSALGSPRYAQAIAADGLLPGPLAKVHPRWSTPHIAIIVTTGLTAALAIAFDYRRLIGMSNITVCVQYLAACVALPIVRRKFKDAPKGFVVPGGIIVPVLGALGSAALFASADRDEFIFAGATLVAGVILAAVSQKRAAA